MPKVNRKLLDLEERESYEDSFNDLPPGDIVAFNELRSCADLLRLYESKQLEIQPDFQRDVVWSKPDQTRFIDSLTKQLPIPSMCISLDYKTDKRLIIDGLQRMQSIINFLSDDEWKLSELDDIDIRLSGKTVHSVKTKSKDVYDRVQNVMIPITVIRCDYDKKSHNEYLFTIFHRLNSGGLKLNNQEIRNCIYNGKLNTQLKNLVKNPTWHKLLNIKPKRTYRFVNEEFVLRFFSFYDRVDDYNGKLSKFLNDYMYDFRNPSDEVLAINENLFTRTVQLIYVKMLSSTPATGFSKTLLEGLFHGVSKNIDRLEKLDTKSLKSLLNRFKKLDEFQFENLQEGLSGKDKVISRLNASDDLFSGK